MLTIKTGYEGTLIYKDAKTLATYRQLRNKQRDIDSSKFGIFFAFDVEQFKQGKKEAGIPDGVKIYSLGAGMYGTEDGLKKYLSAFKEIDKEIACKCDPQEVYCYEYNNHECMFSGDTEAIEIIVKIFGLDKAREITRYNVDYCIEDIID